MGFQKLIKKLNAGFPISTVLRYDLLHVQAPPYLSTFFFRLKMGICGVEFSVMTTKVAFGVKCLPFPVNIFYCKYILSSSFGCSNKR